MVAINTEMRTLIRAKEACQAHGVSTMTWARWDAAGLIPESLRIGGGRFWRVEELAAWARAGCPDRATWKAIQPTA